MERRHEERRQDFGRNFGVASKASKIAVKYDNVEQTQELRCSVTHRPLAAEDPVPQALRELAHLQGIVELEWQG
ncbi:hypothetical protein Ms3S1_29780 [Methylosinus sp. 3S-1]